MNAGSRSWRRPSPPCSDRLRLHTSRDHGAVVAGRTRISPPLPYMFPPCCSVPSRPGLSRRAFHSKPINCRSDRTERRRSAPRSARRAQGESHFAYRIDAWDADGENVIEHLAGVEDLQVAKATYLAACQRWPGTPITLRQGTRVIEGSRRTRIV